MEKMTEAMTEAMAAVKVESDDEDDDVAIAKIATQSKTDREKFESVVEREVKAYVEKNGGVFVSAVLSKFFSDVEEMLSGGVFSDNEKARMKRMLKKLRGADKIALFDTDVPLVKDMCDCSPNFFRKVCEIVGKNKAEKWDDIAGDVEKKATKRKTNKGRAPLSTWRD